MLRTVYKIFVAFIFGAMLLFAACVGQQSTPKNESGSKALTSEVTIYVSQDRVFSEPILKGYEQKMGVRVNAVYDTEETKSTGLANRLLAEKVHLQADVFWSNEPVRTLVLKKRGLLSPYQSPSAVGIPAVFKDPEAYWTGYSARSRLIVYNTRLVKPEEAPNSVLDLADPKWKGQAAIADPRFGTMSFHVAALYAELGDQRADEFFRKLKANDVHVVTANSVVLDMVAHKLRTASARHQKTRPLTTEPRSDSDRVVHATLNFWLTLTKPEVYALGLLVESAGSNPVATAPRFRIEWSSLRGLCSRLSFHPSSGVVASHSTDVKLSVRFKAVSGSVDQAGGLVLRYKDENNYYVVRANALENNYRLYHVINGRRQQFAGANLTVTSKQWHELKVVCVGNQITCFFDGKQEIQATDETFKESGKIGVWTKADSVTYFDDLSVTGK